MKIRFLRRRGNDYESIFLCFARRRWESNIMCGNTASFLPPNSTHTLNERFARFTDAWSRNFSKQCKFNLTLIRLLSHKCRMSLVRLAFQFSMKRLQEVLNFSIFFQSLLKIYFYYCFWHALARAPVSLQCSVLLNRLSNWHTSRNLNAKGKHLCRWIQDNLRSSESSTPMSSMPFAKWFAKCTRTEQRIRKLLKSDGSCDGTTSS